MLKVNLNSATISRTNTCIKTEMLFKRNQLANYAYSTFLKTNRGISRLSHPSSKIQSKKKCVSLGRLIKTQSRARCDNKNTKLIKAQRILELFCDKHWYLVQFFRITHSKVKTVIYRPC